MYALKSLLTRSARRIIDCRQDGAALDPALGRASYLFNPTIAGIEQADAILLVGANPRSEAPCSTPASARAGAPALTIGVIGEQADLTYTYDYLGAGPETLRDVAAGRTTLPTVLKNAKQPMRHSSAQGALPGRTAWRVLALAASLAAISAAASPKTAGTASTSCTLPPRASAGSISASCRATADLASAA